jgi:hypothetical protein
MSEAAGRVNLDEQLVRRRLEAFEINRSFFIQMWLQNPQLAAQAGPRIVNLLTPLPPAGQAEKSP